MTTEKPNEENAPSFVKAELLRLYYRLRLAIYQKANLTQKLNRTALTAYKTELLTFYNNS